MSIFANVFLGNVANDGSGTDLRDAFAIINQNFANIAAGNAGNVIVTNGVNSIVSGSVRRTGNVQLYVNDVIGAASVGYVNELALAGNAYVDEIAAGFGSTDLATINSNVATLTTQVNGMVANVVTLQSNANTQGGQIAFLNNSLTSVNNSLTALILGLQSNASAQQTQINSVTSGQTAANATIASVSAAWSANALAQAGQISAINANVTAANIAIATVAAAVGTANTAMRSYVDAVVALQTANAVSQQTQLNSINVNLGAINTDIAEVNTAMLANVAAANSAANSANVAVVSYVNSKVTLINANAASQESAINGLRANITAANAAIITANSAVVSYIHALVDPIAANTANILNNDNNLNGALTNITTLFANAASQASQIAGANAAIIAANVAMKGYVDAGYNTLLANAASQQAQITTLTTNVAAVNSNVNTLISGTIAQINTSIAKLNANVTTGPITITGNVSASRLITTNGIFWANGTSYSSGNATDTGNITFDGDTISSSDGTGGITLNASGNGEIHIHDYTGFNSGNPSFWVDIGALDSENTGTLGINFSNGGGYSSTAVLTYDWWDGIATGHTNNSSIKHGTLGWYRADGLPGSAITKAYITFDTSAAGSVAPIAVQANGATILTTAIASTVNTTGNINSNANINANGNVVASGYLLSPNVSTLNVQSNVALTNYMTVFGNITTAPALVVYGNAEISGTVVTGSIIPRANVTYDLGSDAVRWRDLYLSGNTITIGDQQISASAAGVSIPGGVTVPSALRTITGWYDLANEVDIAIGETYTLPSNISPFGDLGPFLDGATAEVIYAYGIYRNDYLPITPAHWTITYDVNGYIETMRLDTAGSNVQGVSQGGMVISWVPGDTTPVTPYLVANPVDPIHTSETVWDDGTRVLIMHKTASGDWHSITASGWTGADTITPRGANHGRVLKLPNGFIFDEWLDGGTWFGPLPNPLIIFEEDVTTEIVANCTSVEAIASVATSDATATLDSAVRFTDVTVAGDVTIAGSLTVSPTSIHMGSLTMSAPTGNLVVNTGIAYTMANYQNWTSNVSTIGEALDQLAERLKNAGF